MRNHPAILCLPLFYTSIAFADVAMLDDSELSGHTGQAGLTIDTSNLGSFSEFEYMDINFTNLQNIQVGGHGKDPSIENSFYTDRLDNLRVNISLTENNDASQDTGFIYGFSQFRDLANTYLQQGNTAATEDFEDLAAGYDPKRNRLSVDDKKNYQEGDLIIHYGYLDAWEKDGGFEAYQSGTGLSGNSFVNANYHEAEQLANNAVDFKYSINEIGLAFDGSAIGSISQNTSNNISALSSEGSKGSTSTRLMSNFSIQGYLGPHDLHIKEFDDFDSDHENTNNNGITWNSYFKVTDLDVYLDVSGIQISDLQIHNNRGDLSGLNLETHDNSVGNSSFGFAHAQREIYAVKNAVLDVIGSSDSDNDEKKKNKKDGIAFNTRFKGDIDINHLSFGDTGTSIGEFYITDMYFNNRLTITPR